MKKIFLLLNLLIGFNLAVAVEEEEEATKDNPETTEFEAQKATEIRELAEKRNDEINKESNEYSNFQTIADKEMKQKGAKLSKNPFLDFVEKTSKTVIEALKPNESFTIMSKESNLNGLCEKIKKLFKGHTFQQIIGKEGETDMAKISSEFAKNIVNKVIFADPDHADLKDSTIVMYEHPTEEGKYTVHFKDENGNVKATLLTDLNGKQAHLIKGKSVSSYALQDDGYMKKTLQKNGKADETNPDKVIGETFDEKGKYRYPNKYIKNKKFYQKK